MSLIPQFIDPVNGQDSRGTFYGSFADPTADDVLPPEDHGSTFDVSEQMRDDAEAQERVMDAAARIYAACPLERCEETLNDLALLVAGHGVPRLAFYEGITARASTHRIVRAKAHEIEAVLEAIEAA